MESPDTETPTDDPQLLLGLTVSPTCYNVDLRGMPIYPTVADPRTAKALGAFYTDSEIADFLARWAIRKKTDLVIDPSFGGGVFLRSSCERIRELHGAPKSQVYGVELDSKVHNRIVSMLHDEFSIQTNNLIHSDFFKVSRDALPKFDAVIGNPPFIRYQRFTGASRKAALKRCSELDVPLSQLSSSWAPFLVHSTSLVRDGGRLAMVIPMELTYATYAKPLIAFLRRSFGRLSILTFRKRLFPDISEDTLLLLAEDKGKNCSSVFHRDLPNSGALSGNIESSWRSLPESYVNENSLKLGLQFIGSASRNIYEELRGKNEFFLGSQCNIGIGYVTGGNDFFHLSNSDVLKWKIPARHLRPAVLNGRAFSGIRFSSEDLESALQSNNAAYLLHLNGEEPTADVTAYLKYGKRKGIAKTYKCRSRRPWFSVPHVYKPDCLMTYMSGLTPRLVANAAQAVAPNTLHVLRLRSKEVSPDLLAASWISSLVQLSAELEGHALGGGMLKIEPREAARLIIPPVRLGTQKAAVSSIDALIRSGNTSDAQDLADKIFLQDGLGLSKKSCQDLKEASLALKQRRVQGKQ